MMGLRTLKRAFEMALFVLIVFAAPLAAASSAQPAGDKLLQMIPAESLFCVRVNNLDGTLAQIDEFLTGLAPINVSTQVRMQFGKLLGSPELKGLNMNGSFVAFGTIAADEPVGDDLISVLIPVTDYKQFVSGNPNLARPDGNGVSKIAGAGIDGLIMQVGDFALLKSPDSYDKLIATAKSISSGESASLASVLDADQAQEAAQAPIWAYGNVQVASKAFETEISDGLEQMKKAMQNIKAKEKALATDPNAVVNMYSSMLDILMKETRSLSLTARLWSSAFNLRLSVSAVPGTEMANMFVAGPSKGHGKDVLGYLEDGALMNVAAKVKSPFVRKLYSRSIDLFGTFAGDSLPADEIEKMKALAVDGIDSLGDTAAFSVAVEAQRKPPFAIKYVVAVEDESKFNRVIEQGTEMMETPAIVDFYKSLGMEIGYTMNRNVSSYRGVSIDSARFTMKSTDANSPAGQMITAMYGEGFNYRWAMVDGTWVCAVSDDPDSEVRELIDEVKAGGPRQIAPEMKAALALIPDAGEADFVGTYNFLRWFTVMFAMMPIPMPQMDISTKSDVVWAANLGGGKMVMEIALPKEHLMEIMTVFQAIQQQKMQQQDASATLISAKNLSQIGRACLIYANDYDDRFPANLHELVEKADLSPKILESPRKPTGFDGPSYIYICGQTTAMQPGNIIAYENPEFCSDEINVLFLDSHVEAMKPDEFLRALAATCKRLGKVMPDVRFNLPTKPK